MFHPSSCFRNPTPCIVAERTAPAASDTASTNGASENGRSEGGSNFIEAIIAEDVRTNKYGGRVVTRFPPEPNGYLHIGHAKSICLNFGLARDFDGVCHLRFDDTNPETEDEEYVAAIRRDVRWLGFDWGDKLFYASDYFVQLYDYAVQLIKDGKAYVDSLDEEEIREYRGTVTEPGRPSPYRHRPVEENLDLFERMRKGEFEEGAHVLRAKIDMASPNMKMRDPVLYRIKFGHHYRKGDAWCIYPMYDWAHPLSDAIENITHSICTLEFEIHRPLYDWVVENTRRPPRPHQYEFARLNLDYTVMSKRKLLQLVEEGHVRGWDDPRMPTIAGMRRRGFTPEAIRTFCDRIGVAKADNRIDYALLEYCIRDDLNFKAPRVMCVLRPLKVVLTNYPADRTEHLDAPYYPRDVDREGSRRVPFGRELYIDRDDFREDPPPKFYRLAPGRSVRLRYGYIITCEEVVRDEHGEVVELRCTYDPDTLSGSGTSDRKVRGTIHWVSAERGLPCEVRLYDRLFRVANPEAGEEDFKTHLNPDSMEVLTESRIEPSVADDPPGTRYQFTRVGYFRQDPVDSAPDRLVFNRIVTLKDTWAKIAEPDPPAASPKPKPESAATPPPAEDAGPPPLSEEEQARMDRLVETYGLPDVQARILAENPRLIPFFEEAASAYDSPTAIANWVVNDVLREARDRPPEKLPFSAPQLADLVALIEDGTISSKIAKDVFDAMLRTGANPEAIVERRGLRQVSDRSALEPIVDRLVAAHPDKAEAYRDGKTGLMGFFVGQVMRETSGKANPQLVQQLVRERLG